jgi:hypothetical protein
VSGRHGDDLPLGDPIGLFYAWWRDDALPALPVLPGLSTVPVDADELLAAFPALDRRQAIDRQEQGHRPWLARMACEPVAYGWSAARSAAIGELGITFQVPPGNRYLWDFVTLPPWRGRWIYPRLLQAIIAGELDADHFWIGHDFANGASARGILRAGFQTVGALYHQLDGAFGLVAAPGHGDRAAAAVALFGVPLAGRLLTSAP